MNGENKHAILHLGIDVGRLMAYSLGIRESNIYKTTNKPECAVGHVTDGENLQTFAQASFSPVLRARVPQMGDGFALKQISALHEYMAQLRESRSVRRA
jgi:hypothetical protein